MELVVFTYIIAITTLHHHGSHHDHLHELHNVPQSGSLGKKEANQ